MSVHIDVRVEVKARWIRPKMTNAYAQPAGSAQHPASEGSDV